MCVWICVCACMYIHMLAYDCQMLSSFYLKTMSYLLGVKLPLLLSNYVASLFDKTLTISSHFRKVFSWICLFIYSFTFYKFYPRNAEIQNI